jgi:hypothetical protein
VRACGAASRLPSPGTVHSSWQGCLRCPLTEGLAPSPQSLPLRTKPFTLRCSTPPCGGLQMLPLLPWGVALALRRRLRRRQLHA